jgi:PAS domain S-box-containing protein
MDWTLLQTATAVTLMVPLIVYTWLRHDASGTARTLMWLLVMILSWTVGMAVAHRPDVPRALALALTVPPACFMSPLFLLLMLRYSRSGPFIAQPRTEWALLAPFGLYMLIFLTNDWHGWMRGPLSELTGRASVASGSPLFWSFQIASVSTAFAGLVVTFRLAFTSISFATRRSMVLLGLGTSLPLLTHLIWVLKWGPLEFSLTPTALAFTSFLVVTAIMRYRLFDVQPIARRDVIEASREAVIVADVEQVVVDANPAAARLLGCERRQLLGHPLSAITAAFSCTEPEDAIDRLLEDLEHDRVPDRREIQAKDGRVFEISGGRPIDRDGLHAGYFLVVSDRSSERQAQQLLYQSQKLESIGILAAGVAHEVNNPLAFVRSNFEHLGQLALSIESALERLPKDLAESLNEVPELVDESLAGLDRIQAVVQGLLGFSRMPTQQRDDLDVNDVAAEAIRFAALGPHEGIAIVTDIAFALPRIVGVKEQLVQVLLNLLLNAKKSLADRTEPRITVTTRQVDERVEVCVEDNGPGVPEEIRERIFDLFFTTREPNQGTGLGLAIAFDIARAHNGDLVHETPADGGARFVLRLPVPTRAEHRATD